MSADNGIYILITTDMHKKTSDHSTENTFGKGILAYRVAHCQGIDNIDWYEEHQPYNVGACLNDYFGNAPVFYDKEQAREYALLLMENYSYLEYGLSTINRVQYSFYGF